MKAASLRFAPGSKGAMQPHVVQMNVISFLFLDQTCKRSGPPFLEKENTIYDQVPLHVIAGGSLWDFHGIVLDSNRKMASANVLVLYPVRVIHNFCVCREGMAEISFDVRRVDLSKCLH